MSHDRIGTYRLQLHEGYRFQDAREIAPYLAELGISHLYLSPILRSRPHSQHGYDVVDHDLVDPDLGGIEGLRALAQAWDGGIVVDIVPNHMAAHPSNRWWWDVLKNGPASEYAEYFDIDWDPSEERLKRSILVPILGDHYGRVLEAGELKLEVMNDEPYKGEIVVRYHEHFLPLAPSSRPHDLGAIDSDVDLLHQVLEAQHYRLAYWKAAGRDLNYRRFFAINDLIALRPERPEVFDATHRSLLGLVEEGVIDGLRVDHIDGLRYPAEYLSRLSERAPDCYVIVEKILEGDEDLRADWAADGTTGYEFISRVEGLFVDPGAEKPLSDLYASFTGVDESVDDLTVASKLEIMNTELATDVERLTELFVAVCEDQRRFRDFTRPELRQALRETLASFEVYRTYVDDRKPAVAPEDENSIGRAIGDALNRRPDLDPELFTLLKRVLLLEAKGEDETALAMRFQQASGPVMAKGVEDTLFYRYNRFVAANEVGGHPGSFGRSIDEFHRHNQRVHERSPQTMLAGSTHDTKRSEDVRARLALLSEIPDAWAEAVGRWARMNERYGRGWQDPHLEYLLYQTLVGAWPLTIDRATAYMDKAAKEAKVHTSWLAPNETYDRGLRSFVESVMHDSELMDDVERFVTPLIEPGYVNSLAQVLLRMTSPGVCDFYQGTEIWDFSLVDPDNRRPVDYKVRRSMLERVRQMDAATAWTEATTGAPKMFLVYKALAVRKRRAESFGVGGDYSLLAATGERAKNVVAFARGGSVVSVVPRLTMSVGGRWEDTELGLPSGTWLDALTGERYEGAALMSDLLSGFPVALLERDTP